MVYNFSNLLNNLNSIYQSRSPRTWQRSATVHGGQTNSVPASQTYDTIDATQCDGVVTSNIGPLLPCNSGGAAEGEKRSEENSYYSNTSTSSRPSESSCTLTGPLNCEMTISANCNAAGMAGEGGGEIGVLRRAGSKKQDVGGSPLANAYDRRWSTSPDEGGADKPPGRRSIHSVTEEGGRERFSNEHGMCSAEFRKRGRRCVDWIADYGQNVQNRRVVPSIEPGYLRELIPTHPPHKPESFEKAYVMPGVTHWQHPRFHAYFPAGNSYPSILADMLSDALGCMGFSWAACPAMTELEMIMLDWFGQMIGLPREFLPFTPHCRGGGVIQGSASECNFVALLAARFEIMKELRQRFPFVEEGLLMSKLIAYCSKEAHSSVEKAAMIGMVKLRILETDTKFRLRGDTLQTAITEDRNLGLIPFFVSTTLGTTSVCSFDALAEVGPVCSENDLWLHVDAAYAGSAMVCPEFRYLMNGIEHAMSFNTNPNKWMLVNFDCSTMWVKDRFKLTQALVVDPLYLQHSWADKAIDYRHWGLPLSRRFRALKLWFVIRMYGVEGIQKYIRSHVRLAKKFEALLLADDRFEIVGDVLMGLVCFRLRASDEMNQSLLTRLNSSGQIHMVPASLSDRFVIRFCVCHENAVEKDIHIAYEIIKQTANTVLHESVSETIVENYELEQWEEQNYEKQASNTTDSLSLRSQKSNANANNQSGSFESGTGLVRPSSPPLSAGVLHTQEPTYPQATPTQSHMPHGPSQVSPKASHVGASPSHRPAHTLAERRSFLVRMVSDPKCYNPKIVRHLNMRSHNQSHKELFRDRTLTQAIAQGSRATRQFGPPSSFSSGKYQMSFDHGDSDEEGELVGSVNCEQTGLQPPM